MKERSITSSPSHRITPPSDRSTHLAWLTDLTQVPTAAGREQRVIDWVRRWVADRPDLALTADPAGNLVVSLSLLLPSGSQECRA